MKSPLNYPKKKRQWGKYIWITKGTGMCNGVTPSSLLQGQWGLCSLLYTCLNLTSIKQRLVDSNYQTTKDRGKIQTSFGSLFRIILFLYLNHYGHSALIYFVLFQLHIFSKIDFFFSSTKYRERNRKSNWPRLFLR